MTTATDWPSNVLARRDGAGIFVRPDPVRGQWHFSDLFTAEGHHVLASVSVAIRCGSSPADQQMLSERWLGTQRSITLDDIEHALGPIFRRLLTDQVMQHSAEQLRAGQDQLQKDLFVAGNRDAFAGGYELLAPMTLSLELPTFDQQRLSHALEKQSVARLERLTSTIDAVAAGQVDRLRTLSPGEASGIHEHLLRRSTHTTPVDLIIPAGTTLLRVGEGEPSPYPLPAEIGPLRSVSLASQQRLLVGAQRGVLELDASTLHPIKTYLLPDTSSPRGINCALRQDDRLYATHSEMGLITWTTGGAPPTVLPSEELRQLLLVDGELMVVSHRCLLSLQDGRLQPRFATTSSILHVAATKIGVVIVCEDGTIHRLEARSLREVQSFDRRTPLSAGCTGEVGGFVYSLLSPRQGPVVMLSLFDQALIECPALSPAARGLTMKNGRIAALSNDRCRVELFTPGEAGVRSIPVLSLTMHRGTDVLFLS